MSQEPACNCKDFTSPFFIILASKYVPQMCDVHTVSDFKSESALLVEFCGFLMPGKIRLQPHCFIVIHSHISWRHVNGSMYCLVVTICKTLQLVSVTVRLFIGKIYVYFRLNGLNDALTYARFDLVWCIKMLDALCLKQRLNDLCFELLAFVRSYPVGLSSLCEYTLKSSGHRVTFLVFQFPQP